MGIYENVRAPLICVRLAVCVVALVRRDCFGFWAGFVLILAARFGLGGLVLIAYYIRGSRPLYDLFFFLVIYLCVPCRWFGL